MPTNLKKGRDYELNDEYLNAGIKFWREEKPWWGQDLNNGLYKHLASLRSKGFTEEWWKTILGILRQWVALRPKSKQFIRERGRVRLQILASEYQLLISKCAGKMPNITLLEWSDVEPLFSAAKEIKGVPSPVFASKFCHFMLPGVFPIVDNEVLGGCESYQAYWELCQKLWKETKNKDVLIKLLTEQIGNEVISDYPWPTKIFELCLIGYRVQ